MVQRSLASDVRSARCAMHEFIKATTFLFVLLNPFLLSIYLLDLLHQLPLRRFATVVARGGLIASAVFVLFALTGDRVFNDVLQVRFAAFLIFGGLIFLVVGLRFVFGGPSTLAELRGDPKYLEGSVAMPFLIGPGTVSASIFAGLRQEALPAIGSVVLATFLALASLVAFKVLYDYLAHRHEAIVQRYVESVGRIMALVIGSIAVEMILQGVEAWLALKIEAPG